VPNCDKIIPGMLIAALRVNIPSIVVSGGPMFAGRHKGGRSRSTSVRGGGKKPQRRPSAWRLHTTSARRPRGRHVRGLFSQLHELPHRGAVLALPSTAPSRGNGRPVLLARRAAARLWTCKEVHTPRKIVYAKGHREPLAVYMAIGGSSNTALHIPAVAHYAGLPITLKDINPARSARRTCAPSPPPAPMPWKTCTTRAVSAVMSELLRSKLLHGDCLTVTGDPRPEPPRTRHSGRVGDPPREGACARRRRACRAYRPSLPTAVS
jgi:dihydroxy-acid dehydratase